MNKIVNLIIVTCSLIIMSNITLFATPVRILVLYTHAAKIASGDNIANFAAADIATLNSVCNSSQIPGDQADLVGCFEVNYSEDSDLSLTAQRLTDPHDGYLDEIHFLRYQLNAQIVVLLVSNGSQYGSVGPYNQNADINHTFAVVRYNYGYTFTHEVGHLMGGQHEYDNSPNGSAIGHGAILEYPKNRTPKQYVRTIMCNIQTDQPQIGRWSGAYTDPTYGYMQDPINPSWTNMRDVWTTKQPIVAAWSAPRLANSVIQVPLSYSTIQQALANSQSGDIVSVYPGMYSITSNITVPSGVTLQLNSGSTLDFSGNFYLLVYGALNAQGTTFTSSNSQWYGIELWGASGNSYIGSCTIQNATVGIFDYAMYSGRIERCTIQNNTTGIQASYSSNVISQNYITGNTYGVDCINYSDVDFEANNWIKFNSRGIKISSTSIPYLGTTQNPVYCSIWGNDWDVWSEYGGTISAQLNYWGDYPANPMIYGSVDYSNALMSEPSLYKRAPVLTVRPASSIASQSPLAATDTVGMSELDHARALESHVTSTEAQTALGLVITHYPDKPAALIALAHLSRLVEKSGLDPIQFLSTYASNNKSRTLSDLAKTLTGQIMIRNGDTEGALSLFEGLLLAPGSQFDREALYNAGFLLWYRKGETVEAENYLRQLIKKYPDDPFTYSALATLGELPANKQLGPGKSSATEAPRVNDLSAAFPNPFNPTTTIRYQLLVDGHVNLMVYDVLGRQVAELANGVCKAGYYSSTWNGNSMASGIYYVRFTVTDEVGRQTFSKVNKLLLVK